MDQYQFKVRVWALTDQIPHGKISTYGLLAAALGNPNAVRAVGTALSKNPLAPQVPCHRVLPASLKIGGYCGSTVEVEIKYNLLKNEGVMFDSNGRCCETPWNNFTPLTVTALQSLQDRIDKL